MCEANVKQMEPKHWFHCFSTLPVVFHQVQECLECNICLNQAEMIMIEIESKKSMAENETCLNNLKHT